MRDEAARWFDAELTGKNWELLSIRLVAAANGGAGATRRAFRALAIPEVANGIHVGTYLLGSDADAYARIAGRRPTNQPVNGLRNHKGPFNAAVQNQLIVLQGILLDQAFMHMRTNFPTVVEKRLQIRFSNLYQEQGEPVRSFYKRVERAGGIVEYNQTMVFYQFYRGLLPENVIEASRVGSVPLNTLIDRLISKPVCKPPVYRQQFKPVRPKPWPRVIQQEDDDYPDPDWNDLLPNIGDDPDAPEWTREDDQHVIDLIMEYETSKRFPKRLQKAKDRRDDLELA
ncbi:hypothetical protein RhiirC2_797794 [Rhizophagus irregularis]|uniref:Uncharacterized protein n=1 Tax=Rhizophagus irregularis TaxID=588596 RepID=A0A2N1M7F1_9GLOM|nr:hypothetical protein RhiirC2_797794 [Rhizophagus irregularis]